MLLTRFGYHSLVIVWLAVLGLVDVVGNTMLTGVMSDVYFYKVFLDGALIWWTALYVKEDLGGQVVSSSSKKATATDHAGDPVIKINLGSSEYIYYGFLAFYGCGNLYFHHTINKASTGVVSMSTLIMSIVDVVIAAVALINVYQVASGKFVRLQQRLQ